MVDNLFSREKCVPPYTSPPPCWSDGVTAIEVPAAARRLGGTAKAPGFDGEFREESGDWL